jgi:carbonic anhydrase
LDELIEGYRRFRTEQWPTQRARYEALSLRGQKPHTLVVACSDSRVDPATVFSAGPGELFVVRNVAGLVPPYAPDSAYHGTSAALEFGVRVLGVRRIVVLGHAQCGGVQAMVEGVPEAARDFVAPWVEMARSALDAVPPDGDRLEAAEAAVVRLSLDNLRSFPWIEAARAAGDLELAGFRFGIRTGLLWRLEGTRFVPIA